MLQHETSGRGVRWPALAFALLGTVQVVLIVAITVLAVALPAMQRELGLTEAELALVSSAYGLAFAGLLLLGGRVADLAGQRRVLVAGMALFAVASVVAGLAPSLGVLLAARFGQGVGAAAAAPAAMALLGSVFAEPARRARAIAVWGGLAGIGATGGTLLSGLMTTWVSWRWTLAVGVPAAVVVIAAAPRLLPAGPAPGRTRLDIPGAVLTTVGLCLVSYGLLRIGAAPAADAALPIVAGLAALAAFAVVQVRSPAPLVPPRLLASLPRVGALLVILLTAAGMATAFFMLSLYFQQVRGMSPLWTSLAFLPYGLVQVCIGAVSGRLVGRFGVRAVTATGGLMAGTGLALLSQLDAGSSYVGLPLAGLLVLATGVALAFSGAMVVAFDRVPGHEAGLAAGLANTAMETGPPLGLAVFVPLATMHAARSHLAAADATTSGYVFAFGIAAAAFAVISLCVFRTFPSNRHEGVNA